FGAERAQEPERDHAALGLSQVRKLAPALLDLGERALDPCQEQFAVTREPQRAAGPLEQRDAEVRLQPRQRPAQRRRAGAKLLRRAGDVLQPPGDTEGFEEVPVGLRHGGHSYTLDMN